ncbi:MAG: hypothetical protein IJR69_09585 [Bacteroidaceae bacterium]|nr:hypothetical protein [Bacteroidaceae bacterium]
MKQGLLYRFFLTALVCLLGVSMAMAQVPEPTAKWTFENTEDLMAPQIGSLPLTPCLLGSYSIAPSTLSETGIVTADGPTAGSKAIYVPKKAALKVPRTEGAETSTAYTIMMDIMEPDANPYNGLLQMDEANNNDGDLFTNKYTIGIGSMGYAGNIKDNTWYRVVFTYNENNPAGTQARLYVNGVKIKEGGANIRHQMAPFGFYLLCDEDGEKIEYTYLAEASLWETPLTDQQVSELGSAIPATVLEIATADDLRNFAQAINRGEDLKGVLTSDIDLGGSAWETPIGTNENSFSGNFDGQGHKITGFNATCETDGAGLFGVTNGAVIKDFSIYGTLKAIAGTGSGVVGYPTGSNISGIHSYLEISVPAMEVHHVGGVVGSARGSNTITGCTFHGSMQVAEGSTDNFAGIVAYLGGDKVQFCANYGTISFDDVNCAAGGIAGYCNNTGSYVQNCLNMGKVVYTNAEETPSKGGAIVGWLRTHDETKMTGNCWLEGSATGAGKDGGNVKLTTAFCFNEAQYASGEVCYNLNGDQSVIGWYQTLPGDKEPVLLDSTHKQVYKNGRLHCNGDPSEDTSFSNENIGTTQDDHHMVDGFCDYCGLFFPDGLTPNADGFYELANARQLAWFEQKVNTGELTANAILTADIDFAVLMPEGANPEETQITWTPIGDWGQTRGLANAGYQGHFDGQGHTIKNLNAAAKQNFFGLFGVISSNALIENFTIYGTISTIYQYAGGVAAYSRDANPTIRNVHSYVNINNTCAGGRQGGILGCASINDANYRTTVENSIYSGTLDGNDAGGGGNYGGIVGYVNNSSANLVDITNCLFDGKVVNLNETPGGCTFGGVVGYNNGGKVTIKNCLSIGTVSAAENKYGQFFGALNGNNSTFVNSYYVGDFINGASSGGKASGTVPGKVDDAQLASGEITWMLNEEEFLDAVWRQDIGYDDYPLPTSVGAFVYLSPDGYASVSESKPETFYPFRDAVIAMETNFIEDDELVAYQPLVDEYKETIESWESIDNMNDFLAAYKAGFKVKEAINKSAASYAAYAQACEETANYVKDNSLEGEYADFLVTYLEETVEPNNDYPNGSAPYIMENRNLNDEKIVAEIAFIDQMLQNALAGGITPGTEITRLIVNPNFTEGEDKFEGWTKEAGEGATFATGGVQEIMNIARGKDGIFDIKQTVSDLQNGIYMMALNGLFLDGQDIYSQFYAGQLYLNDTYNYFMSSSEDIITEADAVDQVNCLLSDDDKYMEDEELIGYVPSTFKGCSYAYNAGRYPNFCATEVTDGTLTIGMRNLGATGKGDWMPFGNLRVYYLGNADEANEKLAEVLEGFVARAQIIVDFEISDGYEDIEKKPNISAELKGRLIDAIAGAEEATTGELKMALINSFSELFNEVHACRKAYIAMAKATQTLSDAINDLLGLGLITDEEYTQWDAEIYEALDHFVNGTVSTEEALAIAEKLNIMDQMMPQVDGVYQISTAKQLKLFAITVNNGKNEVSAVLTADIDLAELATESEEGETPAELDLAWTPIGLWGNNSIAFMGHFDGQGHTIKNFKSSSTQNFFGLFGVLSTGCLIENFTIYGDIATNFQYTGGVAGYSRDTETFIRNVHSYVNINNSCAGGRQGGILGTAQNGKATVENCTYTGTLDGNDAGGSGNYGGIIGYVNNSASAIAIINNCLFDGQVVNNNAAPGNCTFGGIVGYNNSGTVTIKNCLSIGTVRSTRASQFFGALNGNNSTFENNYYLGDNINGPGSGGTAAGPAPVKVTEEQLASGEVCFKLNGDAEIPAWYQNLTGDDKDAYPVLDPTHKVVLYDEINGYHNEGDEDPDGIGNVNVNDNDNLNNAAIYNMAGQRLSKPQKGINIVNGKKILF